MTFVRMRSTCKPPREILPLIAAALVIAGLGVIAVFVGSTIEKWIEGAIAFMASVANAIGDAIASAANAVISAIVSLFTANMMYTAFAALFIISAIIGYAIEYMKDDSYANRIVRLGFTWLILGAGLACLVDYAYRGFSVAATGPSDAWGNPTLVAVQTGSGITLAAFVTIIIVAICGSTLGWVLRWCHRCLIFGDKPEPSYSVELPMSHEMIEQQMARWRKEDAEDIYDRIANRKSGETDESH